MVLWKQPNSSDFIYWQLWEAKEAKLCAHLSPVPLRVSKCTGTSRREGNNFCIGQGNKQSVKENEAAEVGSLYDMQGAHLCLLKSWATGYWEWTAYHCFLSFEDLCNMFATDPY